MTRRSKLATGNEEPENEVVFEDQSNPDPGAEVEADMGNQHDELANAPEVTPESEAPPAEEPEVDTSNIDTSNISEAEEKKTRNRQKRALLNKVRDIGTAFGAGKTSMIELAAEVTEAAVNRTINESDAEELYKEFRKTADKRATTDAGIIPDEDVGISSTPQQVSKLRTFIKLGSAFDEGVDIVQRAIAVHLTARQANPDAVMKGSTYTVLGSIVKEQFADKYAGVPMTDEQMGAHIAREVGDKAPPDGAKKIRQALDLAEAARKGSSSDKNYRAPVESPNLDDAIDALYRALGDASPAAQAALDKEREDEQAKQQAREDKKNKTKQAA